LPLVNFLPLWVIVSPRGWHFSLYL
jgi:hypothetical protein